MLTLFHAPESRSTRVLTLIEEMGIADRIDLRLVGIRRQDGSGARDATNPHPEGKVPALLQDGVLVTETAAILLLLTDLFPDAGLGPTVTDPQRGAYLTRLFWYGAVMEPVMIQQAAGLTHPWLHATYRGLAEAEARISAALAKGPWLLGNRFTAADILIQSPYHWFADMVPADPAIRDWLARGAARPAFIASKAADQQRRATMAA